MSTPIERDKPSGGKQLDAAAVISDHMYKFAFEGDQDPTKDVITNSHSPGSDHNKTVLRGMQTESEAVRALYQNRSLPLAEEAQGSVIRKADKLDVSALCADSARISEQAKRTSDPAAKKELTSIAAALAVAGASPFIERARLGAIQLRQGREESAERTFADAIKTGVNHISEQFNSVRQLKQAVIERHEELKVKRTLPEVFKANVDWIDTNNDDHVDKTELNNADKNKGITASTLVRYLMSNYDNIDKGVKGLDTSDITRYWQQQKKPEAF